MSLMYGLIGLAFIKNPILLWIYFIIMTYKLKEKFVFISLLYFLSIQFIGVDFFFAHTVEAVYDHKAILRNGLNRYDYFGDMQLSVGDQIKVLEVEYYGHKDNTRSLGKVLKAELVKKRPFKKTPLFYDRVDLWGTLSIQMRGFIAVGSFVYRLFFYSDYLPIFQVILGCLYQSVYGISLSTVRILLGYFVKKRYMQVILLLILFPNALLHPGFLIVYGPYLLRNINVHWFNLKERVIQAFLILAYFGKINLLEALLIKPIQGIVGLCVWIHFLLGHELSLFEFKTKRFWVVGLPSFLWLMVLKNMSKKWQWPAFLWLMVVQMYYPIPRVSMLQVYQGDATLVTLPFNLETILIDTGKPSSYHNLKKELHLHGIRKLDTLIITHDDLDHSGNKNHLVASFQVDRIVEHKHQHHPFFKILLDDVHYEDENENSLILYFKIFYHKFLVTGDAGVKQEHELIRRYPFLKVDVLKLGHHGSKTSSSLKFLQSLQPKLALISSDPKVYNHPHPEVLKRLHQLKIKPLMTHQEDTVRIYLLPFIKVIVSNRRGFAIMR